MTKDTCFTIDVSVLQVLPECQVSKFRSFLYALMGTFSGN